MASITKQATGRREIQFIGSDQKRRTIRLGKADQKTAEVVRVRIEEISAARITGDSVSPATSQWLRSIGDQFHARLVRAGLCPTRAPRVPDTLTLSAMLDGFIARRDDVKPATLLVYKQGQNHLEKHFGKDCAVRGIKFADASDYRRALRKEYSEAYTAKMVTTARFFWRDAVDRGLVETNAFAKVPSGSQVNPDNQFYVAADIIEKIITHCPDPQWKLLLALSRYAGLRCPSEHLALTWNDIDWKQGRMTVRATKTEHHSNRGIRVVPIFPELRPYLQAVYDERAGDGEPVITRYRSANCQFADATLQVHAAGGRKTVAASVPQLTGQLPDGLSRTLPRSRHL